jgi:hypothetical protein
VKWEYLLLQIDSGVNAALEDYGQLGWELCAVTNDGGFYFKRPVDQPPAEPQDASR